MFKQLSLPVAISSSLLYASISFAANSNELPVVLENAKRAGVEVVEHFDAAPGIDGWAVTMRGEPNVVYTTESGDFLIIGMLINEQGENISTGHLEKYMPKPDMNEFWEEFESSEYIQEGDGENGYIYALLEPNCGYCHLLYNATRDYLDSGVAIRWVPVAFLKPSSAGQVAAIVQSKHPVAALKQHEDSFRSGGIAETAVSAETATMLSKNQEIMRKLGISGTPAIVYQNDDGTTGVAKGMPRLGELADMMRSEYVEPSDPSLARFK